MSRGHRAWRGAWLVGTLLVGQSATADIESAYYDIPTPVYGHGVLPGGEYAAMGVRLSDGREIGVGLYEAVFEDTTPRLVDLDGDGSAEVIAVVSYFDRGAAVRIYDEIAAADHPKGTTVALVAETPPIGRRHRWLAVVGAADLDGDGAVEIAYIDRPHLAKTLRVWRFRGGRLEEVAQMDAVTNHRIGERDIAGGIRHCGGAPEMIVADANWERLIAVTLTDGALNRRDIGPHLGRQSFAMAMAC